MERIIAGINRLREAKTAVGEFITGRATFDAVANYINTGTLPPSQQKPDLVDLFVAPRLLKIDDNYYAATTMQWNPLVGKFYEQTLVCFEIGNPNEEVPPLRIVPPGEGVSGPFVLSFPFESVGTIAFNLRELVDAVRSPGTESEDDTSSLDEFMAEQRRLLWQEPLSSADELPEDK